MKCLMNDEDAKLEQPSPEQIEIFRNTIAEKYPVLQNVWGAIDGLKLHVQESSNYYLQNQFFNGWTHGHYVNSLFTFAPD